MLKGTSSAIPVETHLAAVEGDLHAHWQRVVRRRSFLRGVGLTGAAVLPGSALFASDAFGQSDITKGDVAILRFLAAAELLESDLWSQYNELGGSTEATRRASPRWRTSTSTCPSTSLITPTMISHAMFLNAYLRSKGAQPVNLDAFPPRRAAMRPAPSRSGG